MAGDVDLRRERETMREHRDGEGATKREEGREGGLVLVNGEDGVQSRWLRAPAATSCRRADEVVAGPEELWHWGARAP